ncbi:MAG TPA: ComF family protein [Candidatus Hydrogenedentes bacterium]|nr:ComF family protein [Candidatus Hydrogenedentota bacterium]HOS02371.1 ComF family protein [Candidatus Hydrogenedentota bacterium]
MIGFWTLTLKNLILPIFCKRCGIRLLTEENGFFCPVCWERSPRVERPFCTLCGRPHEGAVGFGTLHNFPCADCREVSARARPYGRIYGAAVYAGAVEDAIKLFKFGGRQRLARPLAAMMGEFVAREVETEQYDYLVPVPLHRVRERDRGFNQARLLMHELLPFFPNAKPDESLRRLRPTRVQSRLTNASERRANVVGAFGVQDGVHLRGKTALLIDDVVTTSGTVSECAKVLRKAGVSRVDVLAAALAVPDAGDARTE